MEIQLKDVNRDHLYRISIVGTSGAGKTTLSKRFSIILNTIHMELDSIYWERGWVKKPQKIFTNEVQEIVTKNIQWILDGNYAEARSICWKNATLIIFIDLPISVLVVRILKKLFQQLIKGQISFMGDRFSFINQVFGYGSTMRQALSTHSKRRELYLTSLERPEFRQTPFLHIKENSEIDRLIRIIGDAYRA